MHLAVWVVRNGVARVIAHRWLGVGLLPVSACRVGQAALAAQGRDLVVVGSAEVGDGLVRDVSGVLTPMCARLFGKRAAENHAKRALAAAATEQRGAA